MTLLTNSEQAIFSKTVRNVTWELVFFNIYLSLE